MRALTKEGSYVSKTKKKNLFLDLLDRVNESDTEAKQTAHFWTEKAKELQYHETETQDKQTSGWKVGW